MLNHIAVWKLFFILYKNEWQLTASSEGRKQLCRVTTETDWHKPIKTLAFLLYAIHHFISHQMTDILNKINIEMNVSPFVESKQNLVMQVTIQNIEISYMYGL